MGEIIPETNTEATHFVALTVGLSWMRQQIGALGGGNDELVGRYDRIGSLSNMGMTALERVKGSSRVKVAPG